MQGKVSVKPSATAPVYVGLVAIEATGRFHRPAHRNLPADGFAVAVGNP